ncbi:MAG: tyrosine-type recombinase/integrase [Solirubrobacteraceae bacterium]
MRWRNLYGEAERIAARAASASTRRQYTAIFRAFCDWLAAQLHRPPLVGDLDADVIATYGRHLATCGGRGGRPAAPATARVYMSMIRALARHLGLGEETAGVRIPRHEPGPPETLTDTDYANLLRVPDRRTLAGKRDHALLRVLGDCGLRSAELRGLRARDLRRPRSNARHYRLYVHGKGGREREVPVPEATQAALDAWTAVHPLARGAGLRDEEPLFVRIGRHGTEPSLSLSSVAVHRIVRHGCQAAGVPDRLAHPHDLRILELREDSVDAVHIKPQQVLDPVIRVRTTTRSRPHLRQPRPHIRSRRADLDRSGRHTVSVLEQLVPRQKRPHLGLGRAPIQNRLAQQPPIQPT